ncbi:MAG TPA: ATPase, T2SS/T4P/T4SS family [Bacillota bacterium]|nr:ATPase, T2SS/T4P/T4SS family [Bacillota bacterium]
MKMNRKRLGDLLVEANLITEEQLHKVLQEKSDKQKLGDALLQQGLITEQQLIEVLEFQLGIPHVSLYRYPIDTTLLTLVPHETARRNYLIPLKKEDNRLLIAMADPMDYISIDDLRLSTGFQIETVIATKDDIIRAINRHYGLDDSIQEWIGEMPKKEVVEKNEVSDDSPIVKLVNQILLNAAQQRASDIHIDPQESKIVIRYRIDGVLRVERTLPKHMLSMLIARIKIMSNLNITEHRLPQDGRLKISVEHLSIDVRVSTLPTMYGEKIVLRLLDLSNAINDLDRLGFNSLNLSRFKHLIEQPNGIMLITGPTGSGKSSTLYAALNQLNTEEVNIITIEDPVEYQLDGINQIQVNSAIGMTFAAGLRSILRQDPNIVMVGEIRDKETAEIAIRASLTGHLVLSTIHTNDSISTITRLIDMGIEPFMVAASLTGIVAQRLVRRVCRDCQQVVEPTEREKEIFAKRGIQVSRIHRGKGCGTCNMSGYRGRVAIHELLVMDEEIRKMIMNNKPISMIKNYALKNKTIFLIDDGLLKVKQGITTTEEVLRVVISD